ncbi:MAG: ABC transporter substrate-binding protein [Patescibacteria group bacterium]
MSSSKFPAFSQWKQVFKVLKKGEKTALLIFSALAFASLAFLIISFYINNTKAVPTSGGTYIEGVVGQPRFINPIYGETDDINRSLIDLVFSGLMTYDKNGKIVKDMAESYNVSDDGKTYNFQLKNNIFWQDGRPLTADDIIFTIKTIQNSDYKSPLRANWIDVNVEKTSDKSLTFVLKTPYNYFLENCAVKIIPKHIWENILPENFALSSYNLQPIGSGPYVFKNLAQTSSGFIKTLNLKSNRKYYNRPPFISNISFQFFEKNDDLIKAANAKTIDGFSLTYLDNNELLAEKKISQGLSKAEKFSVYSFSLPRYFAVFFNEQKTKILSDANIRKGLIYSVNKNELIQKISDETKINISAVDSPILPDFFNYQKPINIYEFDVQKAKDFLDKSGFKDNGSGQREKPNDKKPAFKFKSYLSARSKGTEVTELQGCLSRLDNNFKSLMQGETNGFYGKGTENAVSEFQKKYLTDEKPTGEIGQKTRQKLNELCIPPQQNSQPLKFILTTLNQPQLIETANLLKGYWQNAGVSININAVDISELKTIIKNRNYDALLYGQALGSAPDLYPFWHSSQINDPGLNLSEYSNKDVDALLKDARENLGASKTEQDYEQLQNIITNDAPALFLYNPDYLYWVLPQVKGIDTTKIIDPAKRFSNVENWYIKTKRVLR